ncbi:hypothetical protein E2C01_056952 [Portunus trituberculatus]|uniref:Uncharacterized protein n=1 Tax=Portunus trituberculatus TaxID=210409 RepID=A0A5B7GVI4_PORTR|nr:hypothetical protein [Portunus trituberculatus]
MISLERQQRHARQQDNKNKQKRNHQAWMVLTKLVMLSSRNLCTCFARRMSKAAEDEEDEEDVDTKMVS